MPPFLFGYDFYYFWSVGALLHQGLNPYDLDALHHQLDAIGWPTSEHPQRFTHPVNALWLYWLVAFLPFKISLLLWSVTSVVLIVVCCNGLLWALGIRQEIPKAMMLLAAAIFPATLGTVIWGQMNALLLMGVTLFALYWHKPRYFLSGLCLSLVMLKPHLFVPFLLVVFMSELRYRRMGAVLGLAAGVTIQIAAAYAIAPDSIEWYAQSLTGQLGESLQICGATLGQLVECSLRLRVFRPTLLVIGSAYLLWLVARRGYSLRTLLGLVLPISVCVAPYGWMHSFVVLIPSVFLLLECFGSRIGELTLRYGIAALAAGSLPLVVLPGYQAVWVLFSWSICLSSLFLSGRAEGGLSGREMRDSAS